MHLIKIKGAEQPVRSPIGLRRTGICPRAFLSPASSIADTYVMPYAAIGGIQTMTAVSATSARSNLYRLIDQVNDESQPLTITGQRGNAVLIGEEDWQAIQETLYLESVLGLAESIRQARAEGVEAGSQELDW